MTTYDVFFAQFVHCSLKCILNIKFSFGTLANNAQATEPKHVNQKIPETCPFHVCHIPLFIYHVPVLHSWIMSTRKET